MLYPKESELVNNNLGVESTALKSRKNLNEH